MTIEPCQTVCKLKLNSFCINTDLSHDLFVTFKFYVSINHRIQCVIVSSAYIVTRMERSSALPYENASGCDIFAAVLFNA